MSYRSWSIWVHHKHIRMNMFKFLDFLTNRNLLVSKFNGRKTQISIGVLLLSGCMDVISTIDTSIMWVHLSMYFKYTAMSIGVLGVSGSLIKEQIRNG